MYITPKKIKKINFSISNPIGFTQYLEVRKHRSAGTKSYLKLQGCENYSFRERSNEWSVECLCHENFFCVQNPLFVELKGNILKSLSPAHIYYMFIFRLYFLGWCSWPVQSRLALHLAPLTLRPVWWKPRAQFKWTRLSCCLLQLHWRSACFSIYIYNILKLLILNIMIKNCIVFSHPKLSYSFRRLGL